MNKVNALRANRQGFTLIELLIVVGIISVLIVVLAFAVLPWLKKSEEKATRTLLQQIGPVVTAEKVPPTIQKFKKDAGPLSGRIAADEKFASSQMMLFYAAPSRSVWEGSALYKDRNYAPAIEPEQFAKFTREEGGRLPHLVDAWENPIWYVYDKTVKAGFVFSAGEDGQRGTPDDLIFDSRNNSVKSREELE
ncbi:MAG: prepilin-type N-terminal cleavage/methylation domain-containing protein [Planctomycetes bacterium]|nr:prepilin-type N-terminal cleavage/methylation domain-containing protein [Planctomycetota bacterium]MCB9935137.1 prepilin-type N-terminal cleavage/methylation domain-containing protein [Planctomycetota bacterium]